MQKPVCEKSSRAFRNLIRYTQVWQIDLLQNSCDYYLVVFDISIVFFLVKCIFYDFNCIFFRVLTRELCRNLGCYQQSISTENLTTVFFME